MVDAATEHVHAVRHDVAGGAEERRGVKITRGEQSRICHQEGHRDKHHREQDHHAIVLLQRVGRRRRLRFSGEDDRTMKNASEVPLSPRRRT